MANGNPIIIYANRRLAKLPINWGDRTFIPDEGLAITSYPEWLIEELKERNVQIDNITYFFINQYIKTKGNYLKYLNMGLNNPLKYESTDKNKEIWLPEQKISNSNKSNNRKIVIDSIIAGCRLCDKTNGSENGGLMVITGIRKMGIKNYIDKYRFEIRKSIGNISRIELI